MGDIGDRVLLGPVFEFPSYQSKVQGDDHLPCPAGYTIPDTFFTEYTLIFQRLLKQRMGELEKQFE